MDDIDKKIDEILDKFCKSGGVITVDSNFKKYYKDNVSTFHRMIDEIKLISPNIRGKMSLIQLGIEVCKNGGWINHKILKRKNSKREISRKYTKWFVTTLIAIIIAATPYIIRKCDKDSPANKQTNTNQSPVPKQKNTPTENISQGLNQADSINIQETDSSFIN